MKNLIVVAIVLALSTAAVLGQGGKQQAPPSVAVNVVIDDLVNQNGLYGFGSDGQGAYVNGSQGVQGTLGDILLFKTGNRSASAYYGNQVEITNPLSGSSSASMTFMNFVDGNYLQLMGVGTTRCEALMVNFAVSSRTTRSIAYRSGRVPYTNTAYMLVTHPDSNTWIMDSNSAGFCGTSDNIANIFDSVTKGNISDTPYGRYNMPLRLVLTRQ